MKPTVRPMPGRGTLWGALLSLGLLGSVGAGQSEAPDSYDGHYFRGSGDVRYLRLLDTARSLFAPNPRFQHLAMLYYPAWNGLVEGPTWDAWWVQNSYGTTLAALPFLPDPFVSFLQNSQDLWFDQMGDGLTERPFNQFRWVPPDGALCDAARPGWFVAKQGDGRVDLHDWGMEFTAAGLLMQAELLLIARDRTAIDRYLPRLERCASFIETRRDPTNNLFLAGPAGNLLAPSFAGWKKPDGTYGMAYLTGLSVTYIGALDRLIELEKLSGRGPQATLYTDRREAARRGLAALTTEDGYLIRSLDPDGTRHGVFGAAKHGYFEASPNHDAIALRVVDNLAARRIMDRMTSIPWLRPHHFVIPNFPSYDDLYEKPTGLWSFGTWVNGGHWSTCEARMMLAYYQLDRFEDARASMEQLMGFARRFRMDNPLVKFGSDVYQPNQPVNLTYDAFGPAAAFVRGLFEYRYLADRLEIIPHIPPGIRRLEQRFPIRWGRKHLYLATAGSGPVTAVTVNGRRWRGFAENTLTLRWDDKSGPLLVAIGLGGDRPPQLKPPESRKPINVPPQEDPLWDIAALASIPPEPAPPSPKISAPSLSWNPARAARIGAFLARAEKAGLGHLQEAAHARLVLECITTAHERLTLLATGARDPLPEASERAANRSYVETASRLIEGLEKHMDSIRPDDEPTRRKLRDLWRVGI